MSGADARPITERSVARGAGAALLGRAGALIEIVATPAYIGMFGLATYGLYGTLWAAVNLIENVTDLGMTSALQRTVPQAHGEAEAVAALRAALILGMTLPLLVAAALSIGAPVVAGFVHIAEADAAGLATGIRLFAWALPLWAFVEIGTSALRARRAFGPEIRLRVAGEQIIRLAAATILWAAGVDTLGLLVAHLVSLAVTAGLCARLIARHYDLSLWSRSSDHPRQMRANMLAGLSVLPSNIIARLLGDGPILVLNQWLPGAAGAGAAGSYRVARQLSSVVQLVRMAFSYVMGPLASAVARDDRAGIAPLYGFATRISVVVALPIAATLIGGGHILLRTYGVPVAAAGAMLTLLTLGRAVEAIGGQAIAIQQVASSRREPLLSAVAGLLVAVAATLTLLPRYGGAGMAAAVSLGVVAMTTVPLIQLHRGLGLHPFAPPFLRALLAACTVSAALLASLPQLGGLPWPGLLALLVMALLAGLWVTARIGLGASDKAFLGKTARRLRL